MIQARGLSLQYGSAAPRAGTLDAASPVLAGLNFDAGAGEFISIVGPSGCGKSTLLKLIAGLLRPTSGELTLAGAPPSLARRDGHRIGFVFQDPTLLPWRTVEENIRLPLELAGVDPAKMRAAATESLATIGLSPADGQKFPRMLSGGMRMRVSLARVLVERPEVLLFDEPFAALDDLLRQQLNEEIMSIWMARRPTALFVTHNIAEAIYLSQRVLFMSRRPGAIVGELTIDLDYPRPPAVRATPAFAALLGRAGELLASAVAGSSPAKAQP